MIWITILIYLAMVGLLASVVHPDEMVILLGLGVLGAILTTVAHLQKLRPWSDGAAWITTLALLAWAGGPEAEVLPVALSLVAIALLLGALHAGPVGSPPPNVPRIAFSWLTLIVVVALIAWLPALLSNRAVVVQDAVSPTGMAIRLGGAALALAIVAAVLRWFRARGAAVEAAEH